MKNVITTAIILMTILIAVPSAHAEWIKLGSINDATY